jgi:DNA-binding SARP family transcriptional activator
VSPETVPARVVAIDDLRQVIVDLPQPVGVVTGLSRSVEPVRRIEIGPPKRSAGVDIGRGERDGATVASAGRRMLQISLFGEQVIRNGTGVMRPRSSRALELVAYLVAHAGVRQPRQRIAGLFWPESTDEQALTNLRRELHHLRQMLGTVPSLVADQRDLWWQDSTTCDVDVRAFDRHHAAAVAARAVGDDAEAVAQAVAGVARYRGEFMPGSYEDWLVEVRFEREQRCVDLLDLLCAASTDIDDLVRAVAAARRRIRMRPLEEVGYQTLIELQGDLGDRAGAVSTYHRCASVLERELGVEPSPATRAVVDRLLSAAPEDQHVAVRRPVTVGEPGRSR